MYGVGNKYAHQFSASESNGPCLVESRRDLVFEASCVGHDEEDDSVAPVFSSDTGAGRAHTPQRMNRTNTPQRPRSSSLLCTASAPVQSTPSFLHREANDSRRHSLGKRKQRRRDNDNMVGIEKLLCGRLAYEEGEPEHLTVTVNRRSSLSDLVSDQNASVNAEVRERLRKGFQPMRLVDNGIYSAARHHAGGQWEDAEERFLLVERRLRDIVIRALRSSTLLTFISSLETLLEAFTKYGQAFEECHIPSALQDSLAGRPSVSLTSSEAISTDKASSTFLVVPLGPSPFHRLLLHALCQYRRLSSKSEQTDQGRVVRVMLPMAESSGTRLPAKHLVNFLLHTRLADDSKIAAR